MTDATATPKQGLVSGAQIRAGRALLNLKREDLARAAGLHKNAVAYWEGREVPPGQTPYAVACISRALRLRGVEAFADPLPGVRFVPE